MEPDYVCPQCRSRLSSVTGSLLCERCGSRYPVKNAIPDFVVEDLSVSTHPILRSVSRIDRSAKIYETRLWYPIVYHFYGGLFIPSVNEEVNMITEMIDTSGGIGLDVACGTGMFTRSMAKEMRFVHGADISMSMLLKAREYTEKERITNVSFALAAVEKLPFPDAAFDGLACCGAFTCSLTPRMH